MDCSENLKNQNQNDEGATVHFVNLLNARLIVVVTPHGKVCFELRIEPRNYGLHSSVE